MIYQTLSMGYSAIHNCTVTRLSVVDDRGGEFWTIIPTSSGKSFRDRRDAAIDAIVDAIEGGSSPGEISL